MHTNLTLHSVRITIVAVGKQ